MSTSKKRQLAAILYADIVNYTALMQQDEMDALEILHRFQTVISETTDGYDGEIIKSYGDGSLLLFSSVVNAVECAQDMQIAFREAPKVPLRIGIHVGEFVRKGQDVFGNGINLAARIESLGVAGSVLFSEDVAKRIKNHPEFETVSLGNFDFKNIEEATTVFALTGDGFAVPKRREMKGKLNPNAPKKNQWVLPTVVAAILISLFGGWNYFNQRSTPQQASATTIKPTPEIKDNSLAVLPFANMSIDQENAYFSEGIHDDLLSHLSKIGSMKVISRTSVLRFKESKKSVAEIANQLGVANILEGSVRRTGDQVRINVQLIKAVTDESIWSEIYDKKLTANTIFDIQTEIAKEIAGALQTNISDAQQIALAQQPTENLAAYEAYLRGRQLLEERTGKSIEAAKGFFEQATQLDPQFALAYLKLGEAYYLLVEYASANARTHYDLAWENCEKAKMINPNLAEIYGLECTLYHYDKGDIKNAKQAYEKAIAINPNYADVYFWYSHAVIEIEKDFKLALDILENAMKLNPLSTKFINRLAQTYADNGLYAEAFQNYDKGIDLAPKHIFLPRNKALLYAHTSHLDSAAMVTYQTIERNSNDPKYLRTYVYFLAQLEMEKEIDEELSQFQTNTRVDSLYFYQRNRHATLLKGNFKAAEQYLQAITNLDKDAQKHDPTLAADIYYYKKDFFKVIHLFEKQYPDVLNKDYFATTMFSGYNRLLPLQESLQKYIYSLSQVGKQEKAQQLFDKYSDAIITNVNPNGDQIWEARKRELLQVKNAIFRGEDDLAMEQLANYYRGKVMPDWQFLMIDPVFEAFKNDARYLQVINDLQAVVTQQRAVFRKYLVVES